MRIRLPENPRQRRIVLIAAGALGLGIVSGAVFAIAGGGTEAAAKTDKNIEYELAPSDVVTVAPQPLTRTLHLSGSLTPLRHAVVKSHSVGTLIEMRVNEGDRVRAGALIARIDPRNLEAELDARTAALRKAQADLALAAKNRDNSLVLLNQKLISQNAFDQTEAAYAAGVANVQAAQAQVRLAQIALADTEIRADFSGVVAARHVQAGERVMPDTPLVTLVDLSTMQLEALVPVADVPSIKVGQAARFKVDGFGDREFTGHVERINPQTQQGTRSLTVYLTVANADGALKGGMFADGDLLLQQTSPLIAIPSVAIRNDDQGAYVLALKEGVIARTPVTPGVSYPDAQLTVIDGGLEQSAQVIVAPASTLKPGARAKVAAT